MVSDLGDPAAQIMEFGQQILNDTQHSRQPNLKSENTARNFHSYKSSLVPSAVSSRQNPKSNLKTSRHHFSRKDAEKQSKLILDRIEQLNYEKELLLKQLNLQKQLDEVKNLKKCTSLGIQRKPANSQTKVSKLHHLSKFQPKKNNFNIQPLQESKNKPINNGRPK